VVVVGNAKGNCSFGMPRTNTEGKEVQFHSSLIAALDGASGQRHNLAPLPPGKDPMVPTEEAGWTPKLILMF
jgi:hypothetical protein